ncbi:hypothetical protein [Paenibacillus pinisoli]|uniref:hypothetical protein n=1 Tax=Paenibacillus pinisoli TaxID=1276110 RepID=UPI00105881C9|nr:hypothetical protein [Paenibacillus pinisoli]
MKRFRHSPRPGEERRRGHGGEGLRHPHDPERTKNLPHHSAAGHFVLGDVHSAPDESASKGDFTVGV